MVVLDHAVPVRLIGPSGQQHRLLSQALSAIHVDLRDKPNVAARWTRAFLDFLSTVEGKVGGAAERFVSNVADCRRTQDRYVAALGIRSRDAREGDGSMWLKPKASLHRRVADALIAMSMVTARIAPIAFGGVDPSKVDPERSRTGGAVRVDVSRSGHLRRDSDRRLRLGAHPGSAPRMADPKIHDRLSMGLLRTMAPAAFEVAVMLARFGGGRAFQVLGLDLYDVFVAGAERRLPIPDKGDATRERTLAMKLPDAQWERLLAFVDGPRQQLTGVSLSQIRRLARDPRRRHELVGKPLLTESGNDFITYGRLYRVSRRAAEAEELWIDDDSYREDGRKRFVGFHILRHEYVYARLDAIDALPDQEKRRAIRELIGYMGWSGPSMLAWYSAHYRLDSATRAAIDHNRRIDLRLEEATSPVSAGRWRSTLEHAHAVLAGL